VGGNAAERAAENDVFVRAVTLYFAYGSNMSRTIMRRHAPAARPAGVAELAGYCFFITADGYASIKPAPGQNVHGVLWRLSPRDRVGLDAWENIEGGLCRAVTLPVRSGGRRMTALVYIARQSGEGKPKPGYMELVIAAARAWGLPPDYLRSLQRWLPACSRAAGAKAGEHG
jgi:hypothetical protein